MKFNTVLLKEMVKSLFLVDFVFYIHKEQLSDGIKKKYVLGTFLKIHLPQKLIKNWRYIRFGT